MRISDWSSDVCSSDLRAKAVRLVQADDHALQDAVVDPVERVGVALELTDPIAVAESDDRYEPVVELFALRTAVLLVPLEGGWGDAQPPPGEIGRAHV